MSKVIKSSYIIEENIRNNESEKLDIGNNQLVETINKEYEKIKIKASEEEKKIITEARKKADEILQITYKKSKNITEESKKNGYDEGYNIGYNEGKIASDKLIEEATQIKKEYLNKRKQLSIDLESDIIQLVINISEKIINQKLEEDSETIVSIISKGLDNLNISDRLTIRVSKDDFDMVDFSKNRILAMANLVEEIDVKIDKDIERGGCFIETSKGSVDVGLQTQIYELKNVLNNLLNSE